MSEASKHIVPRRVAVVGRNVAAASLLRRYSGTPQHHWTWLQTPQDPAQRRAGAYFLATGSEAPTPESLRVEEGYLFFDGDRRCPFGDFLEGKSHWSLLNEIPLALRRRTLALGLWSDATPHPWKEIEHDIWIPDPAWFHRSPKTLDRQLFGWPLWIVAREDYLKSTEALAVERGVTLAKENQVVLGLRSLTGGGHQLTQNAPFGFEDTDFVLWASRTQRPGTEGGPTPAKGWVERSSYWETHLTSVPLKAVAGLPRLSLWILAEIHHEASPVRLLQGPITRVTLVADSTAPGYATLQLETLRLGAGGDDRPRHARPDAFLWKLCPRLKQENLAFRTVDLDDSYFDEDPDLAFRKLSRTLAIYSPTPSLSDTTAAQNAELQGWLGV